MENHNLQRDTIPFGLFFPLQMHHLFVIIKLTCSMLKTIIPKY